MGEGESTHVITVLPSAAIPARIASFGRDVVSAWKQNVSFACRVVGDPLPVAEWRLNETPLEVGGRRSISADSTLVVREVQSLDEANYSCTVENSHGRDEIVYGLRVLVPPKPPVLAVVAEFTDSLHLHWLDQRNGGSPILGYVVNYKRDRGDWEELQISAHSDQHMLRNLWCGTRYLLYITAFNRIGTGLPCDIATAHTKGTGTYNWHLRTFFGYSRCRSYSAGETEAVADADDERDGGDRLAGLLGRRGLRHPLLRDRVQAAVPVGVGDGVAAHQADRADLQRRRAGPGHRVPAEGHRQQQRGRDRRRLQLHHPDQAGR